MTENIIIRYENILEKYSCFNKYNILCYTLLAGFIFIHGMHHTMFVFVAGDIKYRCSIPECENVDIQTENVDIRTENDNWLKHALPSDGGQSSKCQRYPIKEELMHEFNGTCTPELFDNSSAFYCSRFIYSNGDSVVRDFNLACQNWKRTLIGTANFAGPIVMLPLTGIFSDKYGRKINCITSVLTVGTLSILKSFSVNYEMMLVLEFLGNGMSLSAYITAFVFAMELVPPGGRVPGNAIIHVIFGLSHVTLGGIAWWLQSWKKLMRAAGGPALLIISYFWIMDESVRWLLNKGKIEDALKVIRKAASINKIQLTNDVLTPFNNERCDEIASVTENTNIKTFKCAIQSNIIRYRFICCAFVYTASCLVHYGMIIYSVSLVTGNKYIGYMLTNICEIPAIIVVYVTLEKYGRKKTFCVSYLLSGGFFMSHVLIPNDWTNWSIVIYILGKLFISMPILCLNMYISELFPTNIRQSVLSACAFIGKVVTTLAPSMMFLIEHNKYLPALLFGSLSLLTGVLILTLPETSNVTLPDTIQGAERMSSKESKEEE